MVCWLIGLSVGWSVTVVSPAKMAELIEMPFGLWTRVVPMTYLLDGGPDAHGKGQRGEV